MGNSGGVLCPSPQLPQWQHLAKPLDAPVTRTLTQRSPPNSGAWKGTHCVWLSVTQPCRTAWPFTSGTLPSRCSPSVTEESGFSDCVKPLLRLTSRSLRPSWGGTPDLARGPHGHPMAQPMLSQGAGRAAHHLHTGQAPGRCRSPRLAHPWGPMAQVWTQALDGAPETGILGFGS